ncbi:MAG: polyisoprenoid-binding protein [Robiginitomaculum sp.]|nr:MAG: polyisoprenoid-binding protein [Robiginitomaculum sp.]
MKYRFLLFALFVLGLSACFTPPEVTRAPELKGNYVLDPAHASVVWRISHVGLSNYTARFDDIRGTLVFDAVVPANSKVDIIIDPLSVSTGDKTFDETISGDYFKADKFTQIRFTSTDVKLTGENTGVITGNLEFLGVTVPVSLNTIFNGAGKSFGHKGKTLGFSATGSLKRSDFGLDTLLNFGIGDEVNFTIEVEFNEA